MGTRSDIIVQRADGTWARSYCHSDGYLSHNGRILQNHYNSQDQADALSALSDLSFLDERIAPASDEQHSYDKPVKGITIAYHRDRGEPLDPVEGDSIHSIWPEEGTWTEFTYVWSRDLGEPAGKWYVGDPDESSQTLIPLDRALEDPENAIRSAIKAPWGVIGHR